MLGITTTSTGLLRRRDSHPLEWQLASLHQIKFVLVDKSGKIHSLVIGVGGFLGAGEKDVLVAFDAVQPTMKDRKMYLVMNTTKDSLKAAPGFKYDSDTTTWVPDNHSASNKMK